MKPTSGTTQVLGLLPIVRVVGHFVSEFQREGSDQHIVFGQWGRGFGVSLTSTTDGSLDRKITTKQKLGTPCIEM